MCTPIEAGKAALGGEIYMMRETMMMRDERQD